MTIPADSPPRAPPVKYKTPLGTRWQKEKAAAERGAYEYPDDARFVGPWVIGECVGKGASGHVKIARHRRTGQLAAVKILPLAPFGHSKASGPGSGAGGHGGAGAGGGGGVGDEIQQQQQQQAQAQAQAKLEKQRLGIDREITMMKLMNHPNIMRIYDVYEGEKELYLILEYVEGGELFDFLVNRGKLAPLEALGYFKQIVYGLNYAHTFSIIHRDLKPENILIHSLHPPLVKIADWGMAAFAPPSLQLETSCGSPHYASPEIVNGFKYTGTATDIWSCGVILYALLTGRLPFDDKNVRNLLAKVKVGRYEMPAFVDPLAKDLLSRMLVVDVNKRITMAEILAHPWLEMPTPGIAYVPAPSVTELAQPLPSALHIDRDLFESLCVIWGRHAKPEVIKVDLLSPAGQGTLAKAFYFLLHKHRERTMEEHGILMDVTDVLNAASSGKVVTKQYSAPRVRAKTLQLTARDSAASYHHHHYQLQLQQHQQHPYSHHHYMPQQQGYLRSGRPAPIAPSGSRSRSRSPSPSLGPGPVLPQATRQPAGVSPPQMERTPSRPHPHPPSPAGPRPQRPRPTSSPATTATRPRTLGPSDMLPGASRAGPPAGFVYGASRKMLPAMERTSAVMSSGAPVPPATLGPAVRSSMGAVPAATPTPFNSVIVPQTAQQLQQYQQLQQQDQSQPQQHGEVQLAALTPTPTPTLVPSTPPVIHAPIPVQATSGSAMVLPMIAAPRVQGEALQRTIDYCARLVNGQAVSWNAGVAREIEKDRERQGCVVMMNEEWGKSRVVLGGSAGAQMSQQQQQQPNMSLHIGGGGGSQQVLGQQGLVSSQSSVSGFGGGEKRMDVDTPPQKKGGDKENWDQQVSPGNGNGGATVQSESGGLGFGSSVPMGREMGNMLNVEEGGGCVTPTKGKGKEREGKSRPPPLDFSTPGPNQTSGKKLPNFASLLGSPNSNSNAMGMPMSPPTPQSSTTAMLLGSPVVGEFKGWFSNLFHWKPHSFVLHSTEDIGETKREIARLLETCGVAIVFEDQAQQQYEGWGPLKCRVDEVYEGNSVVQKQVRFRVEFSVGSGVGGGTPSFVGSPKGISSPASPLCSPPPGLPPVSGSNASGGGPPSVSGFPIPISARAKTGGGGGPASFGENGGGVVVQVVVAFTLEKGALSGFKNVCAFVRGEWRLDGGLGAVLVPVSPRSPKFAAIMGGGGGSVNTSIEQRMLG